MHPDQLDFVGRVKAVFPAHFRGVRVLEIGSLDINGSIRALFEGCDYTGVDVAPGPGVDRVCHGEDLDDPPASFDTVISCEVMEHNPRWQDTFRNMVRLCRPGGLVVMTCATRGRAEHGTSRSMPGNSPLTVGLGQEYYRNLTARDFVDSGVTAGLASATFLENWRKFDLYFVGTPRPLDPAQRRGVEALASHYRRASFGTWKGLRRFLWARYRAPA
jgi:SAM-dependent methyltransferase